MGSGYEDPWHLGGSVNTAFEIVDNTLRRLQQIQLHILEAENALEGMLSSSINAIETALSMPGKYTSARLLIPLRPEIADGDFSDFNAPSSR